MQQMFTRSEALVCDKASVTTRPRGRVVTVDPECSVHLGQRSALHWKGRSVGHADEVRGEGDETWAGDAGAEPRGLSVPECQVSEVDQGTRRPQQCVSRVPAELQRGRWRLQLSQSASPSEQSPAQGSTQAWQVATCGATPEVGQVVGTLHTFGDTVELGHSRLVWLHRRPSAGLGPQARR